MQRYLILLTIILSGCASFDYKGIWESREGDFKAYFEMKENGNCIFLAAADKSRDGIGGECSYEVRNDTIQIFSSNKQSETNQICVFTFDKDDRTLILVDPSTGKTVLTLRKIKDTK